MITVPVASRVSAGRVMPLDVACAEFDRLVTGSPPLAVDGRVFPGMPDRLVPLDEVRARLLRRRCPQGVRDAVWAHLVLLSRSQGATWTVGCVGVALPGVTRIAARLSARFAGDASDIHAAVLAGFVAELGRIDVCRPRIMLRLRWAAYRAGHACLREALDAPVPIGRGFGSAAPPAPWGHPDFVLARAVAEDVITSAEAELIGSTRLEGVPLAAAAVARGMSYEAVKKARRRAEQRLVAYLIDDTTSESGREVKDGDLAVRVADTVTVTSAAHPITPSSLTPAGSRVRTRKFGTPRPRAGRKLEFRDAGRLSASPRTRPPGPSRRRVRRRGMPRPV